MKTPSGYERRSLYATILIFFILASGIFTGGYLFYRNYERKFRTGIENQLSSIANLKVDQIVQWRKERLEDAAIFFKNSNFSSLVLSFFEHPDDVAGQKQLRMWLGSVQARYKYDRIFLMDSHGVERLAIPESSTPTCEFERKHSLEVMRSGQVEFTNFYRDDLNKRIYISVIVPVLNLQEKAVSIGALVMRIDPNQYLYPFIQSWPTPSRTAETLIVGREGNDAVSLSELRFRKNSALEFRVSLEKQEYPAVKAILGRQGIVQGKDYQGFPVIADVAPIPGSPWFLVARMDSVRGLWSVERTIVVACLSRRQPHCWRGNKPGLDLEKAESPLFIGKDMRRRKHYGKPKIGFVFFMRKAPWVINPSTRMDGS